MREERRDFANGPYTHKLPSIGSVDAPARKPNGMIAQNGWPDAPPGGGAKNVAGMRLLVAIAATLIITEFAVAATGLVQAEVQIAETVAPLGIPVPATSWPTASGRLAASGLNPESTRLPVVVVTNAL